MEPKTAVKEVIPQRYARRVDHVAVCSASEQFFASTFDKLNTELAVEQRLTVEFLESVPRARAAKIFPESKDQFASEVFEIPDQSFLKDVPEDIWEQRALFVAEAAKFKTEVDEEAERLRLHRLEECGSAQKEADAKTEAIQRESEVRDKLFRERYNAMKAKNM